MAPAPQGGGVGQVVRLDPLLRVRVPRLSNINNKAGPSSNLGSASHGGSAYSAGRYMKLWRRA